MLDTHDRAETASPYPAWVLACAGAETVGMTAAAGAARLGDRLGSPAALAAVVGGGLVEGVALGWAQAHVLGRVAPTLERRWYAAVTVVVAGLGWAAASAPAVLAGDDGNDAPPLVLVLAGALGLGLVMGGVLGAAQAVVLRPAVRHPWRWVTANAAAWPPAMAVIFLGATTPGATWPVWSVLVLGAVTGAAAGGVLGLLSGWFLPSLDGPAPAGRVVLALLAARHLSVLRGALLGLEVRGRVTGRPYRLPVQYAVAPGGLAVVPGHAAGKTWWRNLGAAPSVVHVLRDGAWAPATATVLTAGDPSHAAVLDAYRRRWPRARVPADQPVVMVRVGVAGESR